MSAREKVRELRDAGLTRDEAEDVLVSEANPADTERPTQRVATDYVNATHPDTGLAVVFVPGEALPAWASTTPTTETE